MGLPVRLSEDTSNSTSSEEKGAEEHQKHLAHFKQNEDNKFQ